MKGVQPALLTRVEGLHASLPYSSVLSTQVLYTCILVLTVNWSCPTSFLPGEPLLLLMCRFACSGQHPGRGCLESLVDGSL